MIPTRNIPRVLNKFLKEPLYACKVLRKRLPAYFYYRLKSGASNYPESVTLFLTHRCNLHCVMCGQWGEHGVSRKLDRDQLIRELTTAQLKAIVDDLASFKPNITLFGGEPFLHAGCLELIRHIKKKNMHCLVITNGSLIRGLADAIVESGLDELNVSIDGGPDTHDQIRGISGLFENIFAGLEEIQEIKAREKTKKPFINLQCTITQHNYQLLDELLKVGDSTGASSLTFHNLIFLDQQMIREQRAFDILLNCYSDSWQGFVRQHNIEPELLYRRLRNIFSDRHSFSVDLFPNLSYGSLVKYYRDASYFPEEYRRRCLSPWIAAYVMPDGEVRPCLNLSYSFGNLTREKISMIWNNQRAKDFRKVLKAAELFPVCPRCTEVYRY